MNLALRCLLAALRTLPNPCDAVPRLCVRTAERCSAFLLAEALPSTSSAADSAALFACFSGTTASSDFSPRLMSYLQLASYYDRPKFLSGSDEISQVPYKERLHVHGVYDCARCVDNLPFASSPLLSSASYNRIDTLNLNYSFAAQYPAHGLPCQRFTSALTSSRA